MAWQDLGQRDNVKRMMLKFFENLTTWRRSAGR